MTSQELFQAALGLADPWRVERSEFDPAAHRLDLYLDFARGARFPCPEGDEAACPVHDTTQKTWRHLDFFQHQAYLHARVPRVSCPAHGVHQVTVPWARPESGFTLLFEALLMAMLAEMPVKAVAEVVGEHDTRHLWLKNPKNLTTQQSEQLADLMTKQDSPRTARAYRWRLQFDAFFEQPAELAEGYLDHWCRGAARSGLHPIKVFAKTVRQHWEGILRWHTTRVNNGILEATNSLIQAAKRRARGYRTTANLIAMTYLIAGKLDLAATHTR